MRGTLSHFEIGTPDAARTKSFFEELLGWTFKRFGDGDQASIETPTTPGGLHDGVAASSLTAYFEVNDIEAAVENVRKLGGRADTPSPVEPGFGRFASCEDSQGLRFGLHEPIR